MRIGIIGYGVVGKAAHQTFRKCYEVVKYDKYQDLDKFEDLLSCNFIFIMVPTPFDCNKNRVDDSAILESLQKLDELNFSNLDILHVLITPKKKNYLGFLMLKV